jgi:hypothetical protein
MKTSQVHLARLFTTGLLMSIGLGCTGSKEEPKTPAQEQADDAEDYTEDEVRDSPDWR